MTDVGDSGAACEDDKKELPEPSCLFLSNTQHLSDSTFDSNIPRFVDRAKRETDPNGVVLKVWKKISACNLLRFDVNRKFYIYKIKFALRSWAARHKIHDLFISVFEDRRIR